MTIKSGIAAALMAVFAALSAPSSDAQTRTRVTVRTTHRHHPHYRHHRVVHRRVAVHHRPVHHRPVHHHRTVTHTTTVTR